MSYEKGNKKAAYGIGNVYREMNDYEKAEKYLKLGSEAGELDSTYNLALLYLRLSEIKKSKRNNYISKAKTYFKEAAKRGHVPAMNNLGVIYREMKEYSEAEKYLKMAYEGANSKNSEYKEYLGISAWNLGENYMKLKKNLEAEKYYKIALDNEIDYAEDSLKELYKKMKKSF